MFVRRPVLLLFVAGLLRAQTDTVKVWQDLLPFPGYREQVPDTTPPFDQLAINGIGNYSVYPYTLRDNLGKQKSVDQWRVLHLENRYLHCRILPDLGGKMYGCFDKLSGSELFYANPTIKKAITAPRGAWTAGGIETSFPIAHSRLAVSPVDFAAVADPSGAATVYVGATDRVSGMTWQVGYTLRPDSTVLEQKVRLYNGNASRQPFQWWTNAAIPLPDSGLRLTYPMWVTAPHGAGTLNSWPVNVAGVDMSNTANYTETTGIFAYGSREPFFAAYNPDTKTGIAHWADPKEVPGKKAWVWGNNITYKYREVFSDDHSGYTEIQAGLLPTQEMMEFLDPQQSRSFTELWIPSRNTAGITRVTADAVLYLARRSHPDGKAVLVFDVAVTHATPGALLEISSGGQTVYRESASLVPEKTFHAETAPVAVAPKYRFVLRNAAGQILLSHEENSYDATAASEVKLLAPAPQSPTKAGIEQPALVAPENDELIRLLDRGADGYRAAATAHSRGAAARKASARLSVVMGRYAEAAAILAGLEKENLADPEARYYQGVALSRLGDDKAARESWLSVAADSPFAHAARFELACALARSGDRKTAAEMLHVLSTQGVDRAGALEIALLRHLDRAADAGRLLDGLLRAAPLNSFLRFEATLLGSEDANLWRHLGADPERILDVVDEYFSIGLYEEPVALLSRDYPSVPELETENGVAPPQNYPLRGYYLGYARMRLVQSPAADFRRASEQPTAYVHPSRFSSEAVLKAAVAQNPSDGSAHYLLGCLLLNRRFTDEALAEWKQAKPGAAHIAGFYPTFAAVLKNVKNDPRGAEALVSEAVAANPSDASLAKLLAGLRAAPLTATPPAVVPSSFSSSVEAADFAFGLLSAGHSADAARVFEPRNFPQDKQPPEVRQAYIETQLQLMLSAALSGKCGNLTAALETFGNEDKNLSFTFTSFGPFIKSPRFQFYFGLIESACGLPTAAAKRWARVAKAAPPLASVDYAFPVLASALLNPSQSMRTIEQALDKVRTAASDQDKGILLYSQGMLSRAAGRSEEAQRLFEEGSRTGTPYARAVNGSARFDPPLPKL